MSGPSTYKPSNGFTRWLDQRLPILRFANDTMTTFPTPRNLNFWYVFGAILTFCLGVQIVTGIVLAMHYVPNADMAFDSVDRIMRDVNYGWLIRNIHATGASMFFLAVYMHMFRGLYYGSYKAPREMIWILGALIYILMMATAFFGYVLPWGQMSFWGATVITNFFSALDQITPHWGTAISTWLWGGYAVGDATLNRFFSLHYLLPFIIAAVVGLHIWALHVPGNNNPLGIDVKGPQDTVPFHPYYTVKDSFYLVLYVIFFAAFVFYAPDFFGNPDNSIPANPLVTPPDIVPEWYLLPFYAMLRSVPQKLIGVLVMAGSLLTLFFVPWLDTSKVRSARFRPMLQVYFCMFVVVCLVLGYCGAQSADAVVPNTSIPLVWVARIGTLYYFGYFWVILPLLGLIETPKPLPDSIAKSVLAPAE
ncbi:MAG TPA: cytochrome b N-terminal domain-containing protein [Rhizomicrobium sp.]|jgi:quinol-cytochrome oxidoreductase complex cytochrome b subunit|nr:cytochrome b N-terminal domain-containing protein [Rhizomicrobium sp.]